MTKTPSILTRIIAAAAARLAEDARIPVENREAFRRTAVCVFEGAVVDLVGAERMRLQGWKMTPSARTARRQRIVAALAAGESVASIAQRERVSRRWVERVRLAANNSGCELLPP